MDDPQRIRSPLGSQRQSNSFLSEPSVQPKCFALRVLCRDCNNFGFCQHVHLANLVDLLGSLALDAFNYFQWDKFLALLAFRGKVNN